MVTPDQATRAFTLFAFSEAAQLRGQQLTILYVRPGCPDSAEAELLLEGWGVSFLTRDITMDDAAQDHFRAAGYRTTPQISVGERSIEGGLTGLKQMGSVAFTALVDAPRPAAVAPRPVAAVAASAPADKEVRELLASLAERASAIASRTTSALRSSGSARQSEGRPYESIHRIGYEVGNILEVMNRLAALGAIPSDAARVGVDRRRPQFGSMLGAAH